ncbi:MAG: hypothetical protein IJ733_08230 [Lachnospiraceae bacterium]|nr:hypothetical protein [Lachnospiraceae bacterium]
MIAVNFVLTVTNSSDYSYRFFVADSTKKSNWRANGSGVTSANGLKGKILRVKAQTYKTEDTVTAILSTSTPSGKETKQKATG